MRLLDEKALLAGKSRSAWMRAVVEEALDKEEEARRKPNRRHI